MNEICCGYLLVAGNVRPTSRLPRVSLVIVFGIDLPSRKDNCLRKSERACMLLISEYHFIHDEHGFIWLKVKCNEIGPSLILS